MIKIGSQGALDGLVKRKQDAVFINTAYPGQGKPEYLFNGGNLDVPGLPARSDYALQQLQQNLVIAVFQCRQTAEDPAQVFGCQFFAVVAFTIPGRVEHGVK